MNRFAASAVVVPLLAGLLFGQDPAKLPPQEEPKVQLNNITLEQFAQSVSKRTKKTFIYGDQVGQLMKQARVQLVAYRDFEDREQLFSLFLSVLSIQAQKLVLVPDGPDTYKIVPENDARRMGLPVVQDARSPNNSFITKVFSLQFISAQEAFTALVTLAQPTAVVQIPGAQMLVVTDNDFNIKRFEEIIKACDIKKPDMIWRVIPLRKAVASDIEGMLRNLLQGIAQQRQQRPGFVPATPGSEQVTVVADRRTNSVLILAEPARIDQIQQLVESLDKEPEFETSGTYLIPLRHRDAEDIAKILNGLYRISTDTTTGLPSGGSSTSAVKPNQPIGPTGAPQPQGGGGGYYSSGQQSGTEPTIIADKKTNSVVLVTDRNTYQMLSRLVQRLDRRRPQVLIKASVVEVQASETFDLGFELARAVDPDGLITTFGRTNMGYSVLSVVGGIPSIVPVDTPGATLAVLKDRFGNIPLLFKALQDKAKISVIDEPEVATEDNGSASITLSNIVQVPNTTVTGTGVASTSFQALEAKTILTITPHITQGGYLRLETEVQIEKFGATSAALPNQPPPKTSRIVKTPFQMAGGRTAVIGGIVTSDRTDSETSVPFLGDIPVFGILFRRNRQIEVRRTLYVFITPYILYDDSFGDGEKLTQERIDKLLFEQGDRPSSLVENLDPRPKPDPKLQSTFKFPENPDKKQ
ncbi:MAG TPA: secretin N-terminal domain-containing protein [Planctomycetota bacterium]|nr:secretin N-terminal domain-containing protein [Planctomycetota bacterium]